MDKRMIDRFTEDFEKCLTPDESLTSIFDRAKKKFEAECGFTPYSSYRSYSTARRQDKNKPKKYRST